MTDNMVHITSQHDHRWSPLLPHFSSAIFQRAKQETLADVKGWWSQSGLKIMEANIPAGKAVLLFVDSLSVFSALVSLQGYHTA